MNIYPNQNWGLPMMNYGYQTASAGQPSAPNPSANVSASIGATGVQGQAAGLMVVLAGLVLLYVFTRDIQNGRK